VSDPAKWKLEIHAPAKATLETVADPVTPTVKVSVTQGGATVILKQVGFSITTERPYLGQIELRADLPDGISRSVYWDIKQDVSPWRTLQSKTVAVTNQWKTFTMGITPSFAMNGIGRFGLSLENVGVDIPIYARNWSLLQAATHGLAEGEALEDGTVSLVGEDELAVMPRANDYLLFLADRDAEYLRTIQSAVRATAGNLTPIAGTQMGYGGLLNLDSHANLDFQDNHFYVDHYNFPHTQWDGRDWRIRDSSSVGSWLGAFQNMAAARQAGRPYTVSEYNQPWPNTHAAEIDALLAAFGAFQDWDSIMHFAYSHGRNWDDDAPNGFNINGDWTKFPNFGQAAWLFRSGAIQTGQAPIELSVSPELRLRAGREKRNGSISNFLSEASGYDPGTPFVHPVRIFRQEDRPAGAARNSSSKISARRMSAPKVPATKISAIKISAKVPASRSTKKISALQNSALAISSPYGSDTGELTYDRDKKLFLIHAPMAAGVFGFAEAATVTSGAIDLQLASSARGFASVLLTSLDQQPIASSTHMLLSTPGYTLRTQPDSDTSRPQQLIKYPGTTDWWTLEPEPAFPEKPSGNLNGGSTPIWMEQVESALTLRTTATKLTVYPLDGTGERLPELSAGDVQSIPGGFRIHLQGPGQNLSPWYELVADQ
jgi:hypothetical protein